MNRIIIIMEGGIIQQMISDEEADITVIEYDNEAEEEDSILDPYNNERAYISRGSANLEDSSEIDRILGWASE